MGLLVRLKQEFFPGRDSFDVENGTDTTGSVSLKRLWIASKNKGFGRCYQGVDPALFVRAVERVPRDLTFIDLGCGKARALILAHRNGFKSLVGVEFSSALCVAARQNLKIAKVPAKIVEADVADYSLPEEPCVTFMFNPFREEVMRQVAPRLRGYVVYVNPACRLEGLSLIDCGDGFAVFRT